LRKRRKKMEVKLGEAPSSKEENEVEAVQLVSVDLQRPPARCRASMVEDRVKLLQGLR